MKKLVFKNFTELYRYLRAPKKFEEPERLEDHEVQTKSANKRVTKPRASKVGK